MAFKKLSPSEIAILNEEEKKAYETAYEEYCERAAFIEKLEQLEKVKMPTVSVKKKGIKRIKTPSVPSANIQRFTADTVQSAILLNATKKVKAVLDSNTNAPSFSKYKASLPCVGIVSPDKVSIDENNPYKVSAMPTVPIAATSDVRFEGKGYKISELHYPQHITPDTSQVKINSYAISGLPEIDTSIPDVSVTPLESHEHIALDNVPVVKPTAFDAVIAKYEVTSCEKTVVKAPKVGYSVQKAHITELSAVPVVKPEIFNGALSVAIVDTPTPLAITPPKISVTVSSQQINSLKSVVIPVAAPTINVTTASVEKIASPTVVSPNDVKYAVPDYHVSFTAIPSVTVPVIDEKKELSTILSKIR